MKLDEFVNSIFEAIINNSNLEADDEDTVLFQNVANVNRNGNQITVDFQDGKQIIITMTI